MSDRAHRTAAPRTDRSRRAPEGARHEEDAGEQAQARGRRELAGLAASSGGGRPLDGATRSRMERAFSADFSDVRIETGARLPKDLSAMTVGSTIRFASSRVHTESAEDRELLGHELAHVVQQRGGEVSPTAHVGGMAMNESPALERSAESAGRRAALGAVVSSGGPAPAGPGAAAPVAQGGRRAKKRQRTLKDVPEEEDETDESSQHIDDSTPIAVDGSESPDHRLKEMVTKLVYDTMRHGWDSAENQELRERIASAYPWFGDRDLGGMVSWIAAIEREDRTFYGDDISDDSDSDHEESDASDEALHHPGDLSMMPRRQKTYRLTDERMHGRGDEIRELMPRTYRTPFRGTGRSLQMRNEKSDFSKDVSRNAQISYPDARTSEIDDDLAIINNAIKSGVQNIDTLTKTRFCVAQYRGIAYNVTNFGAPARRANRSRDELRLPVYAAAVFHQCGVSPGEFYAGRCSPDVVHKLQATAEALEAVLLAKRATKPVSINGTEFETEAFALQDLYTKNYDAFHEALRAYFVAKKAPSGADISSDSSSPSHQAQPDPDTWKLFEGLPNDRNPFVSTGNTPRHALRYAYGIKFYDGHGHERLRPRWRADGRAERPYSGKVYVSLHPPSDYLLNGPLDVVSLNRHGKVHVVSLITAERESSFPAFIPAERVALEHVARYPSFRHEYRPEFLTKYGLTKQEYDLFRERIVRTRPHTNSHKNNKRALGEWLVRYYEARLIEAARRHAEEQGAVLVYRDENGFFTRFLPTDFKPIRSSKDMDGDLQSSNSREGQPLSGRKRPRPRSSPPKEEEEQHLLLEMQKNASQRAEAFRFWLQERFNIHRTPPDGNCLFHALGSAISLAPASSDGASMGAEPHLHLRQIAVMQLRNEKQHAVTHGGNPPAGELSDEYLNMMAQPATSALQSRRWGSDVEVAAIARALGRKIRIYAPSDYNGYRDIGDTPGEPSVYLYHVGGNHWEWLTPKHPRVHLEVFELDAAEHDIG